MFRMKSRKMSPANDDSNRDYESLALLPCLSQCHGVAPIVDAGSTSLKLASAAGPECDDAHELELGSRAVRSRTVLFFVFSHETED
jgi:hypothetical protein